MDYSVRAIGQSSKMALVLPFPGPPQSIASVSRQVFTENYVNIEANGAEAGQSEAVIILFDNAFSMIGTASGGFGINTSQISATSGHNSFSFQWNLLIRYPFNKPVSLHNPFLIVVHKDRGREVHLQEATYGLA